MLLLLVVSASASANTISGVVRNETGAVLSGIRVEAIHVAFDGCCRDAVTLTNPAGAFELDVAAGVYVVRTHPTPTPYDPWVQRVDARSGSQTLNLVLGSTGRRYVPDDPPRASLITVGAPDSQQRVDVRGAAGAVGPRSLVAAVNTETDHIAFAEADSAGAFSTKVFAGPGTPILVKFDPHGDTIRSAFAGLPGLVLPGDNPARGDTNFLGVGPLTPLAGTIVTVPFPSVAPGLVPFGGSGGFTYSGNTLPGWTMSGTINKARFAPGETIEVAAKIITTSGVITAGQKFAASAALALERITLANGDPVLAQAMGATAFLTPTDLPIENVLMGATPAFVLAPVEIPAVEAGRAETTFVMRLSIPGSIDAGLYRPLLSLSFPNPPSEPVPQGTQLIGDWHHDRRDALYLPAIEIGNPAPPSLCWTLLTSTVSGGMYGARAIEDARRCSVAALIAPPAPIFTVPRVDERTRTPIAYRLEPFAPMIAGYDRGMIPSPPQVAFRFPSGRLLVRIEHPDGVVETIGPAPFVQSRMASPIDRHGRPVDPGGRAIHTDVFQMSTMDPRFETKFRLEGRHRILLEGEIEDVQGRTWRGRGTYDIHAGRSLALDTSSLPGTPYEQGDAFAAFLTTVPPLPADVEVRVRQFEGEVPVLDETIRGRASRFGTFSVTSALRFNRPGEYRVDVTAWHRDQAGRSWLGSRTWGGVVAPRQSSLHVHGRRGIPFTQTDAPPPIWFFRSQINSPIGSTHVPYPFMPGDVTWEQESDALTPIVTFDDRDGEAKALLRTRYPGDRSVFDARAALGEAPLFFSRADGLDPHHDPARVDVWAYGYRSVQRPLVRVREQIASWDESLPSMYWRFSDAYGRQAGVGRSGDRPNDFKFQFGGAVIRGSPLVRNHYGIYASLFVLVPDDDPGGGTRTMPPFRGNPGGPDGGALFTLKGQPVDLFFHPTAVRPGSVLEPGQRAVFAGYSAPPLPSKIDIEVTPPSGSPRATIRGQANAVGYFYDPQQDFTVMEPGVWKVKVKIVFDGRTSAGQVTEPFPTGGVLGSRQGEFYFYVVDRQSEPLPLAAMPPFVRPADGPITFTVLPPAGLANVQMTYTTTMPGFILEEGASTALTYTYDAQRLARDFPNLDLNDADGFAGADAITTSFLVSGTDSSGARKHFARQIVLQGEELQMTEQKVVPPQPKRRAAKR